MSNKLIENLAAFQCDMAIERESFQREALQR